MVFLDSEDESQSQINFRYFFPSYNFNFLLNLDWIAPHFCKPSQESTFFKEAIKAT